MGLQSAQIAVCGKKYRGPRLRAAARNSSGNSLELHEAGSVWWVLHSNRLTDSTDSHIFLRKTRESKKAAISQSYSKLQRKILLQNIFITKDECRLLIKVCLKRLKSAAIWAFALFCSVVVLLGSCHFLAGPRENVGGAIFENIEK